MTTTQRTMPIARAGAKFELDLTTLGAACASVVMTVLDLLSATWTGKVVGLAVGAALPSFVALIKRLRRIRATAALLVTGAALVVAYSGLSALTFATDKQPVLPLPAAIKNAGDETEPMGDRETTVGNLGIAVNPDEILHDAQGCDEVLVTSTSRAPLRIRPPVP
jgi:hypothetical protein